MSVPDLYVTNKLLIGDYDPANPDTSNFLTKDDLQKIQDQIIAPTQNIWVSKKNGNDNNVGNREKPVATLQKAIQLINRQVPYVRITIMASENKDVYEMPTFDGTDTSIETLEFMQDGWVNGVQVPVIKATYGKIKDYYSGDEQKQYYYWGNIIAGGIDNVIIQGIDISISDNQPIQSERKNSLFINVKSLYTYYCKITANAFILLSNSALDIKLYLRNSDLSDFASGLLVAPFYYL